MSTSVYCEIRILIGAISCVPLKLEHPPHFTEDSIKVSELC